MFEDATASEVVRRRATAEPTVPKPSNATRQGELTVTRFFLISPRDTRGGNWHLNRDASVAWLPWRHRAGPSATLDEARLSVVRRSEETAESAKTAEDLFSASSALSAVPSGRGLYQGLTLNANRRICMRGFMPSTPRPSPRARTR